MPEQCANQILANAEYKSSIVYYCRTCGAILIRERTPSDMNNFILNIRFCENREMHRDLIVDNFGESYTKLFEDKVYKKLVEDAETDQKLKETIWTDSQYFYDAIEKTVRGLGNSVEM